MPLVGSIKPPTILNRVVLPQPDGPKIAINSESAISRSISFRAWVFPKLFVTFLICRLIAFNLLID